MIKTFFTPDSKGYGAASKQTILDGIKFSSEIGFRPVVLGIKEMIHFVKMFRYLIDTDVFLIMYPYLCSPIRKANPLKRLETNLISKLNKNKFSILYIVDLPIEQNLAIGNTYVIGKKAYKIEKQLFENFNVICVFNEYMKNAIQQRYDISDDRFVKFEILDYGVNFTPSKNKKFLRNKFKIVYTGNASKEYVGLRMKDLPSSKNIEYEIFGNNGGWINDLGRQDVVYKGFLPSKEIIKYISTKAHFGTILYNKNFKSVNYYNFGSSSKFSAYLVAGLPLLIPSQYTYISSLVKKYKVGFSFGSFDEIPQIINTLTESKYNRIRNNCLKLGEKIKDGYFFKKAVKIALKKII